MKELCISNIDYIDAKLLVRKYSQRLNQCGCGICVDSVNGKMIIKWKASLPTTILQVLNFVDYAFCVDTVYDEQIILRLKKAISNCKDDYAIITDYNNGKFKIIEL